MLTPNDVIIKEIRYPELNTTEWQVQVRKFKKIKTGFNKSGLIPLDEFENYMTYDGYSHTNEGLCFSIDAARQLRLQLLEPYYRQDQFKSEKIVE